MNEAETRAEHIDPALKAAGWGVVDGSKILREYPYSGIMVRTKNRLRFLPSPRIHKNSGSAVDIG
jgi:hypothetical protein